MKKLNGYVPVFKSAVAVNDGRDAGRRAPGAGCRAPGAGCRDALSICLVWSGSVTKVKSGMFSGCFKLVCHTRCELTAHACGF